MRLNDGNNLTTEQYVHIWNVRADLVSLILSNPDNRMLQKCIERLTKVLSESEEEQ